MKRLLALALLVMASSLLAACGGAAESQAPPTKEVTLIGTDIAYDTNRIEVAAGQPLKVTLQNDGALTHDFSIMMIPHTGEVTADEMATDAGHEMDMGEMEMEPDVHVSAPAGTSQSVEFTPSVPGEYQFFCTVEGHQAAGMEGTLVVSATQ